MRTSVRRAVQALIEGIDMVTLLAGATTGAWVGYTYYPAAFDTTLRLPATGTVALGASFVFSTVVDMVFAPVRRRLAQADITEARQAAEARGALVPDSLSEALDQVTVATEEDAARRAATPPARPSTTSLPPWSCTTAATRTSTASPGTASPCSPVTTRPRCPSPTSGRSTRTSPGARWP